MKFKELIKSKEFSWLNLFLRDIFLVFVILGIHYLTNYNSKIAFLITGMMVVWVTWHFTDFMNYQKAKKGLKM